jgi:chitosanase
VPSWVLQINLQYAYAERLGDDRGVTYGFCGFTTGTGDGLMVSQSWWLAACLHSSCASFVQSHAPSCQVVEDYTKRKPSNPLARFLPALRAVAGKGDRFTGLNGFDAEVRKLGKDQGGSYLPCLSECAGQGQEHCHATS